MIRLVPIRFRQVIVQAAGCILAGSSLLMAAEEVRERSDGLNLPEHYRQLIADRAIIDRYQLSHHQVEPAPEPTPLKPVPKPGSAPLSVRVVSGPGHAEGLAEHQSPQRDSSPGRLSYARLQRFYAPLDRAAVETTGSALDGAKL